MLNTKDFVVLAGNSEKWDQELRALCSPGSRPGTYNSEDLCRVQNDHYRRGHRSATLVKTIYGYSVRLASGLDGWALLLSGRQQGCRQISYEEAIEFGKNWANEDPDNREFYVSRSDLK